MTALIRHTAVWTGFIGAPGYSNFYHVVGGAVDSAAQSGHDSVRAFFEELKTIIPNDVTVTVDPVWVELTDLDGVIFNSGTVGTPSAPVDAENANAYAGNAGASVEWVTGQFIAGRRLKGRTFLVPLAGIYGADGQVGSGFIATIVGAANWIVSASQVFGVWHRPTTGADGAFGAITGVVVRPRAATLRSRSR